MYIINYAGIAYHQNEVLYITKPTVFYTHLLCDEIQHGNAVLMIYTLKRDDIPSLSAWIKKTLVQKNESFLEAPPRIELGIRVLQTRALPLGHGAVFFKKTGRLKSV